MARDNEGGEPLRCPHRLRETAGGIVASDEVGCTSMLAASSAAEVEVEVAEEVEVASGDEESCCPVYDGGGGGSGGGGNGGSDGERGHQCSSARIDLGCASGATTPASKEKRP